MIAFQPGDVVINSLVISGSSTTVDVAKSLYTLSIYESDYDDEELPLIRSLIERDPRGPWENG